MPGGAICSISEYIASNCAQWPQRMSVNSTSFTGAFSTPLMACTGNIDTSCCTDAFHCARAQAAVSFSRSGMASTMAPKSFGSFWLMTGTSGALDCGVRKPG